MAYYNLPTENIEQDQIKLEYLLDSSLRLIRLIHKPTGINLFAETPDFSFTTNYGKYFLRGGHRLWVSPETWDVTYAEENRIIQIDRKSDGLILKQSGTSPQYLHKEIRLNMDPNQPRIHLVQTIRNDSVKPIDCSAWGLTMLAPGGTAIIPITPASNIQEGLLPDRNLVLWPYTKLNDPRLDLRDNVLMLHTNDMEVAIKIGIRNPQGWMAYLYHEIAFVKRTYFNPSAIYPDFGCNAEIYTNGKFVELEALSGLENLAPGESLDLEEEWEVFPFTGTPDDLFQKLNK